jgi:hypothetical protein
MIFDNSENPTKLVAEGVRDNNIEIHQQDIFNQIIKP